MQLRVKSIQVKAVHFIANYTYVKVAENESGDRKRSRTNDKILV